jgi:hypothetical protein
VKPEIDSPRVAAISYVRASRVIAMVFAATDMARGIGCFGGRGGAQVSGVR